MLNFLQLILFAWAASYTTLDEENKTEDLEPLEIPEESAQPELAKNKKELKAQPPPIPPADTVTDERSKPVVRNKKSNAQKSLKELRALGQASRARRHHERTAQIAKTHHAQTEEKVRTLKFIHDVPSKKLIAKILGQLSKSDQETYDLIFAKNAHLEIKSLEKVFTLAQNLHALLQEFGVSPRTAQTFLDAVQVWHPAHYSDGGKALPQAFVDIIRLRFLRYVPKPGYKCSTLREFENLQIYYRNLSNSVDN